MILSAKNPRQMCFDLMQNNPEFQQGIQALKNSGGGASFQQMAFAMAKQKGVSEEQLMQMFNTLNK